MTTISHEPVGGVSKRTPAIRRLGADVWASCAISVTWLAVMFDALFGPNIYTSNGAGTNTSVVPSAVPLAFFAFLTSWVVARYGFRRDAKS